MVMGLARGETLEQRLKRDKQLLPAVDRACARPLARRTRGGAQGGLPASRHQAGQHHPRCQGRPDADRFRRLAGFHGGSHGGDDGDLHAALCRRRAAHVGQARTVDGHLRRRRRRSITRSPAIRRPAPWSAPSTIPTCRWPNLSPAGFSPGTLHGIDAGLALRAKDRPQSIAVWRDVLSSAEASDSDATVVRAREARHRARSSARPGTQTPAPAPQSGSPSGSAVGPQLTVAAVGHRRQETASSCMPA